MSVISIHKHLPGITKILPGSKAVADLNDPGALLLYTEAFRYLRGMKGDTAVADPLRVGVLDLETQGQPRFRESNPYGIQRGKEGLSFYAGEILLAGMLDINKPIGRESLHSIGEEVILRKVIDLLNAIYLSGGILVGQNMVRFDIRWVVHRASRYGISIPQWLLEATSQFNRYKLISNRIVDSTMLFGAGEFGPQMKLESLGKFWGRPPSESEGHLFGERWAHEGQRGKLIDYNRWDMLDALLLALMSGVLDSFRTGSALPLAEMPTAAEMPIGRAWDGTDYKPDEEPSFVAQPRTRNSNIVFMGWLTAPAKRLREKGPLWTEADEGVRKDNWNGRRHDTRETWPFKSHRQDPTGVQIVGFIAAGQGGELKVIWNPGDEFNVIVRALRYMSEVQGKVRVYVDKKASFRSLLTFRASLYNIILEPWVNGFRVTEWLRDLSQVGGAFNDHNGGATDDSISRAAIDAGMLSKPADIESLPLYCGQNEARFQERAGYTALAARHYIVHDPYTLDVPETELRIVNAE